MSRLLVGALQSSLRMANRQRTIARNYYSSCARCRSLSLFNGSLFSGGAARRSTTHHHRVQQPDKESNTTVASVLMIDVGAGESQAELRLQEADFPKGYVDMAHPDDYTATEKPLQPQLIEHQGVLGHHRLLLRVSFKLDNDRFSPFTFVLDTGAPFHLYLSQRSIEVLREGGRWKVADPVDYVEILGNKAVVRETPPTHSPANIMGLKMLKILKLRLMDDKDAQVSFSFDTPFDYF